MLPPEVLSRPKKGFAVPIDTWFRGDLGDLFRDTVLAGDSVSRDHLELGSASRWLDEHRAGSTRHAHRLWVLLMFELWARAWLRREVTVPPLPARIDARR